MTVELNELKGMLETFRDGVVKAIDDKVKVQSDAANTEIATLKGQLGEATKAIATLQEEIAKKKSFGLPGVDGPGEQKFSWSKFFVGLAKNHKASKSLISFDEAKKFWDTEASFEQRVCRDYNAGDGTAGGFLVPPQIYQGDIIDTVYANTAIMKLPVLKFTGLSADMPIPVDGGNLTAYDLGETAAPTKTTSTFKLEWLRPKKNGAYVDEKARKFADRLRDRIQEGIEQNLRDYRIFHAIDTAYDRYWKWDLMVCHPPCTFLTTSGAKWFYHPDDTHLPYAERRPHPLYPNRRADQEAGLKFAQTLLAAPIPFIALENPVGILSSRIRKPDQTIQPYEFGEDASKRTCLWLHDLPRLPKDPAQRVKGRIVEWPKGSGIFVERWSNQTDSGQNKLPPSDDRWKLRSKTFHGIAKAMAAQWSDLTFKLT